MTIGSGVDVIEIARIERVLGERDDRIARLAVRRSRRRAAATELLEARAS